MTDIAAPADGGGEAVASDEGAAAADGGFADLGLRSELLEALADLGYEEPTPIQRQAIPPVLGGRDLLGQAATGTGKTAAFALPLLERLADRADRHHPIGLVLVPTRELAVQVSGAVHRYGRSLGARVLPVYGGQPIGRQLAVLHRGVDVVVATPGRALDHIGRRSLPLDGIEVVVLDEADEMLDMGFAEDIDAILEATPAGRQTVLFSATLPPRIATLAKRHLTDPVRIDVGRDTAAEGGAPLVTQRAYTVRRAHKPAALGRILDLESPAAAIVFCRTRTEVDSLTETMNGRGYRAEALHGGMDQAQRDRVMGRLRSGSAELLVATDVAARGLDIDHLSHVVNYDVPAAPEAYVHRIGRVGRAGRQGVAITLAEPRERRLVENIERLTGTKIALGDVPTVAELRARRLEATTDTVRSAIVAGDLDDASVVVDALVDEFDVRDIALAAVKLAHEALVPGAGPGDDEEDIPTAAVRDDRPRKGGGAPPRSGGGRRTPKGPTTRLFVGAGRKAGIRPQDLVGAIANESRLSGGDIGAIEIAERYSLVEVPLDAADEVVAALRASTIKGKRQTVRRERNDS